VEILECLLYILKLLNIADVFNRNSGAIQAIVAIVLVIVTIYYAVQTKKTVQEMEKSRKYEFLPILEIRVVAESLSNVRLTLSNVGKGLARSPKIFFPKAPMIELSNMVVKQEREHVFQVDSIVILQMQDSDRKITVEYLDVFSRKIKTEARLSAETNDEGNARRNHLTIENWNIILPE
jgi:hypothetical protein